jgi:hypothetical protein
LIINKGSPLNEDTYFATTNFSLFLTECACIQRLMTGDFLDTFAHPAIEYAGVWRRKEELAEATKPGGLTCFPKVRCR